MKVHFMGLDLTHYNRARGEHVVLDMPAPPAKGTRIIFNGGLVYVVTHAPEYFINTGRCPWSDEQHADDEGWIEACWVLVSQDRNPEEAQHSSADPREGMTDVERERFDAQMNDMLASIRASLAEPDPNCPQCGRPCSTTVWRQDGCSPRRQSHCYKSNDQMQELRDMKRGC